MTVSTSVVKGAFGDGVDMMMVVAVVALVTYAIDPTDSTGSVAEKMVTRLVYPEVTTLEMLVVIIAVSVEPPTVVWTCVSLMTLVVSAAGSVVEIAGAETTCVSELLGGRAVCPWYFEFLLATACQHTMTMTATIPIPASNAAPMRSFRRRLVFDLAIVSLKAITYTQTILTMFGSAQSSRVDCLSMH